MTYLPAALQEGLPAGFWPCLPVSLRDGLLAPAALVFLQRGKERFLNSTPFNTFRDVASLLCSHSEAHPLSPQQLPHSLAENGGWRQDRSEFSSPLAYPACPPDFWREPPSVTLPAQAGRHSLALSFKGPLSPLESALGHPTKDGHPACPEPRREEPQLATKGLLLSLSESALTQSPFCKLFRIRTYEKKPWGGWQHYVN